MADCALSFGTEKTQTDRRTALALIWTAGEESKSWRMKWKEKKLLKLFQEQQPAFVRALLNLAFFLQTDWEKLPKLNG